MTIVQSYLSSEIIIVIIIIIIIIIVHNNIIVWLFLAKATFGLPRRSQYESFLLWGSQIVHDRKCVVIEIYLFFFKFYCSEVSNIHLVTKQLVDIFTSYTTINIIIHTIKCYKFNGH